MSLLNPAAHQRDGDCIRLTSIVIREDRLIRQLLLRGARGFARLLFTRAQTSPVLIEGTVAWTPLPTKICPVQQLDGMDNRRGETVLFRPGTDLDQASGVTGGDDIGVCGREMSHLACQNLAR